MNVFVGIDIAARKVDVVVRCGDQNGPLQTFKQTPQDHQRLARQLVKRAPACVVMEATGIYYLDVATVLHAAGLPVAVINPKSFHHFAKLKLKGSKTDGIDTGLLAEYGQCLTPTRWTPPDVTRLALRDIGRQINRLVKARTQAKNRLHALQARQGTLALLIEDEQDGIGLLDHRIARLRQAGLALVASDEQLAAQLACMTAATGIREVSALALLGELGVLPAHLKAPQVSRHAGLDVRLTQSGSSLERPGRLSKAGNAYLRSALYMPALSAVQHDPHAKAFYAALVARGKKKMQALCAVMRKYLAGLWACLRHNTPFDSAKLFSQVQQNA